VGVFAGADLSQYLALHMLPGLDGPVDPRWAAAVIANDKDYLPAQIAFRLGLRGPAVGVGAACATGLAALHLAAQSLLAGECDAALVGAASLRLPLRSGYLAAPDGPFSRDGRTRSYDAAGTGAVYGSGGVVAVLRRAADAAARGERVLARVRGTAVYNPGAARAGFAAPTAAGHARVVAEALAVAGLSPSDVQYVEGNGTATPIGDAAEIAGLAEVFGGGETLLGSVRSAVGHLQAAAGLAGLLAAAWGLRAGVVPATLHHERPHPALTGTRLVVSARPRSWPAAPRRRAVVSAFGVGGFHAAVALEEADPARERPAVAPRAWRRVRCWRDAPTAAAPARAAAPATLSELAATLAAHLAPGAPPPPPDAALSSLGLDSRGVLEFFAAVEGRYPEAGERLLAASWRDLSLRALAALVGPEEGAAGPPTVVLLPPLGCGASVWGPLLPFLSGHRVVALDAPELGAGDDPVSDWGQRLPATLRAAGVSGAVHLVGWSFGATLALAAAQAHPARVASVTAVCPAAWPGGAPPLRDLAALMARVREAVARETAGEPALRSLFAANTARAWDQCRALTRFDAAAAARRVDRPLLVVAGDVDGVVTPRDAGALAACARGADFERVPCAGHLLPVTHPAGLAARLGRFLALSEARGGGSAPPAPRR